MACNDDDDDDKEGKIKKSFAIFYLLLFLTPSSISQTSYQQFHLKGVLLPDQVRNGAVKYRKDVW